MMLSLAGFNDSKNTLNGFQTKTFINTTLDRYDNKISNDFNYFTKKPLDELINFFDAVTTVFRFEPKFVFRVIMLTGNEGVGVELLGSERPHYLREYL